MGLGLIWLTKIFVKKKNKIWSGKKVWLILAQQRGSRDSCGKGGRRLKLSTSSPGSPRWQGAICRRPGQLMLYGITQAGRHAAQSRAWHRPPGTAQPRALEAGQPGILKADGDPGRARAGSGRSWCSCLGQPLLVTFPLRVLEEVVSLH